MSIRNYYFTWKKKLKKKKKLLIASPTHYLKIMSDMYVTTVLKS